MQYQQLKDTNGNVDLSRISQTDMNGIVSTIPNDPDNRDWIAYQTWLAAGGVPAPPAT